jgi:hypothetical protein
VQQPYSVQSGSVLGKLEESLLIGIANARGQWGGRRSLISMVLPAGTQDPQTTAAHRHRQSVRWHETGASTERRMSLCGVTGDLQPPLICRDAFPARR